MAQESYRTLTTRFAPDVYEELRTVAKLDDQSMNRFVVEAVMSRLRTSRARLMRQYETTVQQLKGYAERDPEFDRAIEAFAEAEAAEEDPAEGTVVADKSGDRELLDEILSGG